MNAIRPIRTGRPRKNEPPRTVACVCAVCQGDFNVPMSEALRGGGKYCSLKCKRRGQQLGLSPPSAEAGTATLQCAVCGTLVETDQCLPARDRARFCCTACVGVQPLTSTRQTATCANPACRKSFTFYPSAKRRGLYCSRECRYAKPA